MKGFTIRKVGIGDGVQYTSLPENYFRETGKKLIDISEPWYLDYNPYVQRGITTTADQVIELWNYPEAYPWPKIRDSVYLSNAEIHASVFGIKNTPLIRPRLYRFEDFPVEKREKILFHPVGKSHGQLPWQIIDHVIKKYKPTGRLYQIGLPGEVDLGIPKIETPTMWDLVKVISEARMFIGVDSGPSWIAACYPDVTIKKVRVHFQSGFHTPSSWVPLQIGHMHSFWDDRAFQIFGPYEEDCGFTMSYRKL